VAFGAARTTPALDRLSPARTALAFPETLFIGVTQAVTRDLIVPIDAAVESGTR
jgi:hypothetical protein